VIKRSGGWWWGIDEGMVKDEEEEEEEEDEEEENEQGLGRGCGEKHNRIERAHAADIKKRVIYIEL
jgi:hypothetical protein